MSPKPRRFAPSRLACLIVMALLPCLVSNSCAPRPSAVNFHKAGDLPARAAADYYYLVYLDQMRAGNKEQAATILARLAEVAPSPSVYLELANLHWSANQRDKAVETLKTAIAAHPEQKELYHYLANAYQMQRRFDEALVILDDLLARSPGDPATIQEMATLYIDAGKPEKTLELIGNIPPDKRAPAMEFHVARAATALSRPKEAQSALERAVAKDPKLVAAWAELGLLYEQHNESRKAEAAYTRVLELGEDSPEVWLRLVRLAVKAKNPGKVTRLLEKAPDDRAFLFEVMSILLDAGQAAQAKQILARMAKSGEADPDLFFYQAVLAYEGDKNPRKAITLLEQVPETHPHYDKSLGFRVQLSLELDENERALELVMDGKRRFPDQKEFHNLEAAIYDKLGNTLLASQTLEKAIERWPDDADLRYRLGVTLEKLKRRGESLAVMEHILVMDPDNQDAANFLGYSLAEESRDLDRAMELVQKALSREPDNPYYIDSLAWVYFKQGKHHDAWREIRRAVAQALVDPTIWEHYGDIAAAVGDKEEARKGYRKALEQKSEHPDRVRKKLKAL